MKNPLVKVLAILFFLEILLFATSLLMPLPELNLNGNKFFFRFISSDELFDFRFKVKENATAEKLFTNYSLNQPFDFTAFFKRKPLCFGEKKTSKSYFLNPDIGNGVLALDKFFSSLHTLNDTTTLRIAHYGDSQLEGDRLTCCLRNCFQHEFGGSGIGYVPFTDITSHTQLNRNYSANWIRYNVFNFPFRNNFYGASGIVFNILGSTFGHQGMTAVPATATVSFDFNQGVVYDHVSVFYGKTARPFRIISNDDSLSKKIAEDTIPATDSFFIKRLRVPSNLKKMKFEFLTSSSTDLFGFLIDGKKGIQVDNYSIRGHSGDRLLNINTEYLGKQLKSLNTRLVILQFGANVVPYIYSDTDCKMLEALFYKLFMKFKEADPDISILVIGAGDMMNIKNGQETSYPMLPKIRDAQKNAARKAGCAFWDLFDAMGGENSISSWAAKGYASKNGHFYPPGQLIVANELYRTIMAEYHMYLFRQRENNLARKTK